MRRVVANKVSTPRRIYALIAAAIVSYFLSGSMRPEIQLPITAVVVSLGVFLMLPFGEPSSGQRAVKLIPYAAFIASFIWLLFRLHV
jgi:hypothetical protein